MIGRGPDCQGINHRTQGNSQRVDAINAVAPSCVCEKYRMSKHSPCIVGNEEILARFVFSPMHVDRKGNIKPSIFSHVHSKGCSIQRDSIAKTDEIVAFVNSFLTIKDDRAWIGVLLGVCQNARGIRSGDSDNRAVCVFDTAERHNTAHGEMCQTHYVVEEADKVELRRNLFAVFNEGVVIRPPVYREGAVWNELSEGIQARSV